MSKRTLIHKHFFIYDDQVKEIQNLKEKTGGIDAAKIVRSALAHFLGLDKNKQLKIIREGK